MHSSHACTSLSLQAYICVPALPFVCVCVCVCGWLAGWLVLSERPEFCDWCLQAACRSCAAMQPG